MKKKALIILASLLLAGLLFLIVQALMFYHVSARLLDNSAAYLTSWSQNQTVEQQLIGQLRTDLSSLQDRLSNVFLSKLRPLRDLSQAALILSQDQHRYIMVLQNSEELRATGGFFGSYAILNIDNGLLQSPDIGDVYEPDGQFEGFIEAPNGAKEYLSAGRGLRLPDSNWWPDFPTSAEQIMTFFSDIKQENYDGVIAVNLLLIEDLLEMSGPIYLPDYRSEVNARNFANLARADRDQFFAGSQEKINFLNHFFTHFKLRLSQLSKENPRSFLPVLIEAVKNKNIQIYSRHTSLQQLADRYQLSGRMHNPTQGLYYYLVESNVGINKANRAIDRQVRLDIDQQTSQLTINWRNDFDTHYVNYQRIYLHPDSQVVSVQINQQNMDWRAQIIETEAQEQFLELSFLLSVLAQSEAQVQIKIQNPPLPIDAAIYLQKQSGLRSVLYQIQRLDRQQTLELRHDQSVLE